MASVGFYMRSCFRHLRCYLSLFIFLPVVTKTSAQTGTNTNDSITIAIAPAYDSVSSFHRFWLGEGYRKLWAAPVPMRVIHLDKEKGGLTIDKPGGGFQTKSLRLKAANGREYVLRTVQKYPERKLPEKLKRTVTEAILRDQVVTAHPYAALTVPPFEEALGIPHTSPEIVYVGDDAALGKYRSEFAHAVYLFEERAPGDTLKTLNTETAQEKVEKDNDFTVDAKLIIRARLLDMLLGNWDRHEDQWRWERNKTGGETIYKPIPRDMDAVYYNTTGVFPWFISHQWLQSRFQGLKANIRDINGFNSNNQYFDRYFLTHLNENDWKDQIDFFEKAISDSVIRTALKRLPDTIYTLTGQWLEETLINRRNNLRTEALTYYRFLSKTIDVPGSDKREEFSVHYTDSGYVDIGITKIKKDGTKGKVLFQRELDPHITREIRLYGLDGNDVFTVTGTGKQRIKIRMIGGEGRDSFAVSPAVHNKKHLLIYDRSDEVNILPQKGATLKTSTDSTVNIFERRTFKYDQSGPLFLATYDLDQGVQLKAGLMQIKHGFRKEPYASKQELDAWYSTGRKSFTFTYFADLKQVWGKAFLNVNILAKGPHNLTNFFGIGNETVYKQKGGKNIDYYRNRLDYINGDVRLKWNLPKGYTLSTGLAGQYYTSSKSNNKNHFLHEYNLNNPDKNVFTDRLYGGIVAGAERSTRNDVLLPSKGMFWQAEIRGMQQLGGESLSFSQLYSHLDFYIPVFGDSNIVVASRVGGGTTFGNPLFFQQMQLGGLRNLRGFHTNRFTGKTMVYHNAELRLKLFDFTSYLFPGRVGMIAFNDVGRVWVPKEKSGQWHDGYGGGLYIVPADLVLIQAVVGHSKEGTQPYISVGFSF